MKKLLFIAIACFFTVACSTGDDKAIKGLEHSDLYLNLTDKGFVDESIVTDAGVSHKLYKESFGAKYNVVSNGTSKFLYGYTATVNAEFDLTRNLEAPQFLAFVSSLPYDSSRPEEIKEWVMKNYNTAKADTIVGGVQFELKAPTPNARVLVVSKE